MQESGLKRAPCCMRFDSSDLSTPTSLHIEPCDAHSAGIDGEELLFLLRPRDCEPSRTVDVSDEHVHVHERCLGSVKFLKRGVDGIHTGPRRDLRTAGYCVGRPGPGVLCCCKRSVCDESGQEVLEHPCVQIIPGHDVLRRSRHSRLWSHDRGSGWGSKRPVLPLAF
jgi:hypothetical protein